jgi:hypothetical protein
MGRELSFLIGALYATVTLKILPFKYMEIRLDITDYGFGNLGWGEK